MSFRKSKNEAQSNRQWRRFRSANLELSVAIGLPMHVMDDRHTFDYLLMHGYIDRQYDPTEYSTDDLEPDQYDLLCELVEGYFAHGFSDPGCVVLRKADLKRLDRKHPDAFSWKRR